MTGFFCVCHCFQNLNFSLITPLPEYLLKALPAITVLFKLHEGTTNSRHKKGISHTRVCFLITELQLLNDLLFK